MTTEIKNNKKGILALKEEYEKEVKKCRDYYQENKFNEDMTSIIYISKTYQKVIRDLEELLKWAKKRYKS